MARNWIDIGCTPHGEACAQVGDLDYNSKAQAECAQLVRMMQEINPPIEGTCYGVRRNPHDFGSYMEVVAYYDENVNAQEDWAFAAESGVPEIWDDKAREALKLEAREEA